MKKNSLIVSLLLGGSMLFATSAMAQDKTVKLTTSKAVGETMTLSVNQESRKISVDWGDGVIQTYEISASNLLGSIEGQVKGNVISIMGGGNWHTLNCAGCDITDIDLKDAKELRSLYCRNNQISKLDLRGMTKLVDLDCSHNSISRLVFTKTGADNYKDDLSAIENLNLSYNQLTGSFNMKLPTLQNLNISNNAYKNFFLTEGEVRTLNCANNELKGTLKLSRQAMLNSLICHGNAFTALELNENTEYFKQLVCDNNQIESLDLSAAEDMVDLSCSNNNMSHLKVSSRQKDLNSMNVSGNALTFSVLPVKSNAPTYLSFLPQAPFSIADAEGMLEKDGVPYAPVSVWSKKVYVNLKPYSSLSNNRYDSDYQWFSVLADGTEQEMTRRTSSSGTEDFYVTSGKYAFFTPQKKAYIKLTSKSYGYEIKSMPIAIGDDITGVENVMNDGTLQISIHAGQLVLSSQQNTAVKVYSTAGKLVWSGFVNGTVQVNLPKGMYVVNGKKAIL